MLNLQLLKLRLQLRWSNLYFICIPAVDIIFISNTTSLFVLRTLHGDDYETEMRCAMLLENLQHIHKNLCFESRIKPPNPYREMWPIDFTNKKIQSCQDCGGKFSLKDG